MHRLLIGRRVDYKVACLMHGSFSDLTPTHLADGIYVVADGRRHLLRSATDRKYVVPRTRNNSGDQSFAVAGTRRTYAGVEQSVVRLVRQNMSCERFKTATENISG